MITNINLKENNEEKPTIDIYIYNSIKSEIISKKLNHMLHQNIGS